MISFSSPTLTLSLALWFVWGNRTLENVMHAEALKRLMKWILSFLLKESKLVCWKNSSANSQHQLPDLWGRPFCIGPPAFQTDCQPMNEPHQCLRRREEPSQLSPVQIANTQNGVCPKPLIWEIICYIAKLIQLTNYSNKQLMHLRDLIQ